MTFKVFLNINLNPYHMEILKKEQILTAIGNSKFSISNETKLLCTQYATGITAFDSLINQESLFSTNIPTNIIEHNRGYEISIMYKFKLYRVAIPLDHIISITIEDKAAIIEQKDKSVIGRALLGGILLGPLGAVIGGMTGIGKNDKILYSPDVLLTILYKNNGFEKVIVFTCKHTDRVRLLKLAPKIFKDKLK